MEEVNRSRENQNVRQRRRTLEAKVIFVGHGDDDLRERLLALQHRLILRDGLQRRQNQLLLRLQDLL